MKLLVEWVSLRSIQWPEISSNMGDAALLAPLMVHLLNDNYNCTNKMTEKCLQYNISSQIRQSTLVLWYWKKKKKYFFILFLFHSVS